MKRNKIKTLRNKADRLFQQYGMVEHKSCLVCGRTPQCLHHFFTKASSACLRYDRDNGIPLCRSCHFKVHTAEDPRITITIKERKGEDWYRELVQKRQKIIKVNIGYYKAIIEDLEKRLDKIERMV